MVGCEGVSAGRLFGTTNEEKGMEGGLGFDFEESQNADSEEQMKMARPHRGHA